MKLEDEGMELTHFNPEGRAQMVDVSGKEATFRVARPLPPCGWPLPQRRRSGPDRSARAMYWQWRRWQASWLPRRTAS